MSEDNPFRRWVRHGLIGIGLFLAGAVLAFGYSYRPLHGALSWQVDQLEARLDERNQDNVELSDRLARQESLESTRIDPATLAQVKKELAQTKRVLTQAEKDLKRATRKRKESSASAATWRKRFESLRDSTTAVAENPTDRTQNSGSEPATAPAAPAGPAAESSASSASSASQPASKRGILSPSEPSGSAPR